MDSMKRMFAEKIKHYRMERELSQEQLAQQLAVSNQAVSKWECAISYPDIEMIVQIADFFEVTVDELLREKTEHAAWLEGIPDDNVMRVVQCRGRQVVNFEADTAGPMLLKLDSAVMKQLSEQKVIEITFQGKANINGDLYGNVNAMNGLFCGNVACSQELRVNGGMNCGNVKSGQEIHVSGGVNCGNVKNGQEIYVSGGMNCAKMTAGNIEVSGSVSTGEIKSENRLVCHRLEAERVSCKELECKGNLYYKDKLIVNGKEDTEEK